MAMDAEKKKMLIMCTVGAIAIIGFLVFAFGVVLNKGDKVEEGPRQSAKPGFPDAQTETVYSSKTQAYASIRDDEGEKTAEDLWSDLSSQKSTAEGVAEAVFGVGPDGRVVDERPGRGKRSETSDDDSGRSGDTDLVISQNVDGTHAPTGNRRVSSASSSSGGYSSSRPSSAPAKPAYSEPVRVAEQDDESEVTVDAPSTVPETVTRPQRTTGWNSSTSGVISSLTSSEPINTNEWDSSDERMIRCCFAKDMKITNGQRITVRILEDLYMDDVVIPANSRLTAMCTLNERLNVEINGFELNGKIFKGNYVAYDKNDGNPGIYCTAANDRTNQTVRSAALSEGASSVSSVLGAAGGIIGSLGSRAANVGSSVAQSKFYLSEVKISAGYEFYLKKINSRR